MFYPPPTPYAAAKASLGARASATTQARTTPATPTQPINYAPVRRVAPPGALPWERRADTTDVPACRLLAFSLDEEHTVYSGDRVLWTGIIALEGTMTGDKRYMESGSLRWENLPIPFAYQPEDLPGHEGAVPVGLVHAIERIDDGSGLLMASGIIDRTVPGGWQAIDLIRTGILTGVSVDLDEVQAERYEQAGTFTDNSGNTVEHEELTWRYHGALIRSLTGVRVPAFKGASISLIEDPEPEDNTGSAIAEIINDGDWSTGTLAAEIDQATESLGEFSPITAVANSEGLPQYIQNIADKLLELGMPEDASIVAAVNIVKRWARKGLIRANGGPQVSEKTATEAAVAVAQWEAKRAANVAATLQASAAPEAPGIEAPVAPPSEWFDPPTFSAVTPLTITDDGRVFGHLAAWDTCHTAHKDMCVSPPTSASNYAYFHVGAVNTCDGEEVAVGRITLDTGHANTNASAARTLAHYENTGAAVADVRAGEDAFGIYVVGALRPGLTAQDIRKLRSAPLSGDWRTIRNNLELVAALAVNVPGFPIPRTQAFVASGAVQSLVASGAVAQTATTVAEVALEADTLSASDREHLRAIIDREKRRTIDAMAEEIERTREFDSLAWTIAADKLAESLTTLSDTDREGA